MTGQCWELYQDCETRKRPLCRQRDNPNVETDLRFLAAAPMLIAWLCDELEKALKELKAAQVELNEKKGSMLLADESETPSETFGLTCTPHKTAAPAATTAAARPGCDGELGAGGTCGGGQTCCLTPRGRSRRGAGICASAGAAPRSTSIAT